MMRTDAPMKLWNINRALKFELIDIWKHQFPKWDGEKYVHGAFNYVTIGTLRPVPFVESEDKNYSGLVLEKNK